MSSMKADVRKYAMQRVNTLENARMQALKEKYTKPGTNASGKELAHALKNGTMPFRKGACFNSLSREYAQISDIFDLGFMDVPEKFDDKAFEAEAKPIRAAANKARDFIMLGQDEPALDAIREFEQTYG